LKKRCTRLAAASDKAYQLLAHGCWFSPGTPASSTTKTGRHDIAEILLKVALNTTNQTKPIYMQMLLECATCKWKVHNRNKLFHLCRNVSFLHGSHYQFLYVSQGMKTT
jgi:hypothetical protein